MENEAILSRLERDAQQQAEGGGEETTILKFLLFSVGEAVFALAAEDVREISTDNEIYYIPFVPPYIRGYANRHGQPYTVYDLNMLFESAALQSSTLLILKSETDQIALLIDDVREIIAVPQDTMLHITSADDSSKYFSNALNVDDTEVFVLKVEALLERLERDLERS
jgi:chemotaxis signal transduction protein